MAPATPITINENNNIIKRYNVTIKQKDEENQEEFGDDASDISLDEKDYVKEDEYMYCRYFWVVFCSVILIGLMLILMFFAVLYSMNAAIAFENLPYITTELLNAIFYP